MEISERYPRPGSGPQVSVVHRVEPGVYVIYVRDAGDGNRADFTLEVTLTPAS